MSDTNTATRFAEMWALLNEDFSKLDHLRTINLGFADGFMNDSQIQSFLTAKQIAAIQATKKSYVDGETPGALKVGIPYIAKESVNTETSGATNLCTLTATNNQSTGLKQFVPIGALKLGLVLDDQAFLQNAVDFADSVKTKILDQVNDAWNRLDIKYQSVVEANKNQAWTGVRLPDGWAVVGDALQIPYEDLDNVIAMLPKIFEEINMPGPFNLTLDTMLEGKFQKIANQGTGNSVNTQYSFQTGKLNFRKSANMPATPDGVSHVMYAQQAGTSVTFSRVPDAFRSSINRNIDGRFDIDDKIDEMPITIGDLPFHFGQKMETVCDATKQHTSDIQTLVGQPVSKTVWTTDYYGIIQPVSAPSTIASPVIRVEILDPVVVV